MQSIKCVFYVVRVFHYKKAILRVNYFALKNLFSILVLLLPIWASGQSYRGTVVDDNKEAIPGAIIQTLDNQHYASSKTDGAFVMPLVGDSSIVVKVSFLGYGERQVLLQANTPKTVVLTYKSQALSEVSIQGQRTTEVLKNSAQTVSTIDVKPLQSRSLSAQQIINRTAGVHVRETGGLGSFASYNINGISGKGIKLFIDGIPLDNTGYASDINLIPINLINSIEIYKGIVPVSLGSDALGGAINIVTRQDLKDYVDASVEVSSFNTYRATFAARKNIGKYGFAEVRSFYNYSDNNYFIDAEIANEKGKIDTVRVRRFHDAFESYNVGVYAGLQQYKHADLLKVGFEFNSFDKELQHKFASQKKPFGQANLKDDNTKASLAYQKKDFFLNGLDVNFYGFHLQGNTLFSDTGKANYNWYGEEVNRFSFGAETGIFPRLLDLKTTNDLLRLNLSYELGKHQSLSANVVTSKVTQRGSDTAYTSILPPEVEDPFKEPQFLAKTITGIAHEINWLNGYLTNVSSVKYNLLSVKAKANVFDVTDTAQVTSNKNFGWSEAMKISIVPEKYWVILNYEQSVRLPDQYEQFGDRSLLIANPDLRPEKSNNINIGFNVNRQKNNASLRASVRYFERDTKDFIRLVIGPAFAQYQNFGRVRSRGGEFELLYRPIPIIQIGLNATYQDLRNITDTNNLFNNARVPQRYFNTRIPNIPLYFGNLDVQLFRPSIIKKGDVLTFAINSSYVPDFFLLPEVDGNANNKVSIPKQWINNLGVTYTLPQRIFYAGLEVKNITDVDRFDNFGVQKPGRSIHFKIGTFIQ